MFEPRLNFDGVSPVAPKGLGGLVRDLFGHGRINAAVGYNGCLVNISYSGNQHLGGFNLFTAGLETAWYKLFRVYINIGGENYYPTLHNTQLHPFGYESHDQLPGVAIDHDMLLLEDALVQRVHVAKNPKKLPIRMGMLHQESVTAVGQSNREWSDMVFEPKHNAFIWSSTDINPKPFPREEESLAQRGNTPELWDSPRSVTWIGLGSDLKIKTHCGYHARSKHYLSTSPMKQQDGAFYLVFATSRPALVKRLKQLSKTVYKECDKLIGDYHSRLAMRPRIDVGNPILNSAFNQYPEVVEKMKLPDRPGASRATLAGYFVWGWDGMMPLLSSPLANEPEHSANNLRFFQETRDSRFGLPHSFSTGFKLKLKGPFPSQAQYIAGLYLYTSITGDLSVAREVFPTCKYILEQSRKDIIKDSGLVLGPALWPDFPEAMEENGDDISSMNNSMLYQGLRSMEYIAVKLGHAKLAADYRAWAVKLRKSFVKYLYDQKHGYFISSCSSINFKPRKHYCAQAIFWLTPFARELVSHAPGRIASFMDKHLRSAKCLLTLPHWDTAWMADGNQLGSSYPAADSFYLGVHKVVGDDYGIKAWLGDVEWFWRHHTAPEAFTPEAENEDSFGPDNWGGKQAQSVTTWYAGLYTGLAGLDFDHEGLTLTPWGTMPVDIRGLKLHGVSVDFKIRGEGKHIGSLKLNGKSLPAGSRKINWKDFKGRKATIELVRSKTAPEVPVIVRADGLSVKLLAAKPDQTSARISSEMSGEVAVQAKASAKIRVDGKEVKASYDRSTGTFSIPFPKPGAMKLEVAQ
jgi:hypothetical protein